MPPLMATTPSHTHSLIIHTGTHRACAFNPPFRSLLPYPIPIPCLRRDKVHQPDHHPPLLYLPACITLPTYSLPTSPNLTSLPPFCCLSQRPSSPGFRFSFRFSFNFGLNSSFSSESRLSYLTNILSIVVLAGPPICLSVCPSVCPSVCLHWSIESTCISCLPRSFCLTASDPIQPRCHGQRWLSHRPSSCSSLPPRWPITSCTSGHTCRFPSYTLPPRVREQRLCIASPWMPHNNASPPLPTHNPAPATSRLLGPEC